MFVCFVGMWLTYMYAFRKFCRLSNSKSLAVFDIAIPSKLYQNCHTFRAWS